MNYTRWLTSICWVKVEGESLDEENGDAEDEENGKYFCLQVLIVISDLVPFLDLCHNSMGVH